MGKSDSSVVSMIMPETVLHNYNNVCLLSFQGLDTSTASPAKTATATAATAAPSASSSSSSATVDVVRRRSKDSSNSSNSNNVSVDVKNGYRCSLINLEETRDDELDAILGELSVLESQFEDEIAG